MKAPTNEPPTPTSAVANSPMPSGPGISNRATAPTMSPMTNTTIRNASMFLFSHRGPSPKPETGTIDKNDHPTR